MLPLLPALILMLLQGFPGAHDLTLGSPNCGMSLHRAAVQALLSQEEGLLAALETARTAEKPVAECEPTQKPACLILEAAPNLTDLLLTTGTTPRDGPLS